MSWSVDRRVTSAQKRIIRGALVKAYCPPYVPRVANLCLGKMILTNPQDLDSFELRALKNLVNGECAYLTDSIVQRLIWLSLATRSDDGKVHASELGKDVVLQSRPLRSDFFQ